jgi:hypothetical protein
MKLALSEDYIILVCGKQVAQWLELPHVSFLYRLESPYIQGSEHMEGA